MKYLIYLFPRSGNEANRGVEFRHSTRYSFRIRRKVQTGSVLMETEYLNVKDLGYVPISPTYLVSLPLSHICFIRSYLENYHIYVINIYLDKINIEHTTIVRCAVQ